MTKSSLNINNNNNNNTNNLNSTCTELRQMSNPIPISHTLITSNSSLISNSQQNIILASSSSSNTPANTAWQFRFTTNSSSSNPPQQQQQILLANQIDDSTQFDPGIMDQCISHNSVSPAASVASYSLSPTTFAYQNTGTILLTTIPHAQYQQEANNFVHTNLFTTNPSTTTLSQNEFALPVDLESLLVNTTLSDSSSHQSTQYQPAILQNQSQQQHSSDLNEEDNVNNQINPMFLFRTNPELVDFNNNSNTNSNTTKPSGNRSKFQRNRINKIDEELDDSHLDTFNFNTTCSNQRSIAFNFQQQQQQIQQNDFNMAMSLPANSFLNNQFQFNPPSERSDPVLTQLVLNPSSSAAQSEGSTSSNSSSASSSTSSTSNQYPQQTSTTTTTTVQFINQTPQFYAPPVHLTYSSSLPANYLINSYQTTSQIKRSNSPLLGGMLEKSPPKRASQSSLNIKSELVEPILPSVVTIEDNDEKFSKLKLSSPLMNDHSSTVDSPLGALNAAACMFDIDDPQSQLPNAKLENQLTDFNDFLFELNSSTNTNSGLLDVNQLANDLKFESSLLNQQQQRQEYEYEYEDEEEDDDEDEDDDDDDEDEEEDEEEYENQYSASFSFQSSAKKPKQQFYVGSVGSALTRTKNSRKHARINSSLSGVDVHHTASNQSLNSRVLTANDSKNIFSNLQFEPFNQSSAYNNNYPQAASSSFVSTSLPPISQIDSLMMFNNNINNNKQSNTNQQSIKKLLDTPSVNVKSLLNKKTRIKQAQEQKSKKRQRGKAKESVFDCDEEQSGDEDLENELDEEDEDELSDASDSELRIKMEHSDFDSNDSSHPKRTNSKSAQQASTPSSYVNSEAFFDLMMSSKNRDSYFWQYNIQSKGPKTKKVLTLRNKDPHLHRDFYDPVFQLQSLNARGGAALNKLRKGDGNDVTPNAEKLYNLGNQIRDFIQKSYQMNSACFGVNSTSQSQLASSLGNSNGVGLSASLESSSQMGPERVNLKREKNKIASRACRLKKKAQHEANKIKLFGLNEEHKQFIECINSARDLIRKRLTDPTQLPADKKMVDLIDDLIKQKIKTRVAGNTDGYVHSLMMTIEKQRALHGPGTKSSKAHLIDLNQFNAQYSASQQFGAESSSFGELQHQQNLF